MAVSSSNNLLQQISQGQITKKPIEDLSYIYVAPKLRNAYLRGLIEQFREEKKMSETQIIEAIIALDELIETEKIKDINLVKK
jgi:hypothetical protein